MKGFLDSHQDSLKRKWQENRLALPFDQNQRHSSTGFYTRLAAATAPASTTYLNHQNLLRSSPGNMEDDLVSTVVPQITVVLEGRSICQRINLQKHSSYQSLAKALREMFVDAGDHGHEKEEEDDEEAIISSADHELALSNAVPGHLVAYEDMEDDLLLVGDLNWKDFVRVAKRIRIIPLKANSRKGRAGA